MKKFFIAIFILLIAVSAFAQHKFKKKNFIFEISIGPRIPLGITRDDITTGLGIDAGFGYRLKSFFEPLHFSIDFGNSSPHNPNMVVIRDYYSYYGRPVMETVSIIGLPLTTRLHFPVKEYIRGYVGGGFAYYWFSSRMEDPLYGNLNEPRKRDGYGPIAEAGLITDFFSEKWLVILRGNFSYLKTSGKSLSIREGIDPRANVERTDKYLSITVGIRHYF